MKNLIILSIAVCVVYGFVWWKFYKTNKQLNDNNDTKLKDNN